LHEKGRLQAAFVICGGITVIVPGDAMITITAWTGNPSTLR
jgi:hypothetical protein